MEYKKGQAFRKVFQMTGCETCKHNRKRTIRSKNCLKDHRAVFGYNCKDYEKGGTS